MNSRFFVDRVNDILKSNGYIELDFNIDFGNIKRQIIIKESDHGEPVIGAHFRLGADDLQKDAIRRMLQAVCFGALDNCRIAPDVNDELAPVIPPKPKALSKIDAEILGDVVGHALDSKECKAVNKIVAKIPALKSDGVYQTFVLPIQDKDGKDIVMGVRLLAIDHYADLETEPIELCYDFDFYVDDQKKEVAA